MKKIPTEVFSRIVGYFSAETNWNSAKKEERSERKMLSLTKIKDNINGNNNKPK